MSETQGAGTDGGQPVSGEGGAGEPPEITFSGSVTLCPPVVRSGE